MVEQEEADYQRAATGYLIWPLAAAHIVREPATASRWSRIHARQALTFGLAAATGYVVVLALPLAIVIASPNVSTGTTVLIYAVGLLLDVFGALFLIGIALYYSSKAGRGDLFTIPLITPLTNLVFRVPR